MEDCIIVSRLELFARVGVPDAERATPQRLTISLRLVPRRSLAGLDDDIANTIDYAAVCESVRSEAESRPRRLIETLAEDIALMLLKVFPLKSVEVEVRKYILPGVEYIAVRVLREGGLPPAVNA